MSRERFDELLDDWAAGRLAAQDAREFDGLVSSNAEWAEEARDHRELVAVMRGAPRVAAPAGLLASAIRRAQEEQAAESAGNVVAMAPARKSRAAWFYAVAASIVLVGGGFMAWEASREAPARGAKPNAATEKLLAQSPAKKATAVKDEDDALSSAPAEAAATMAATSTIAPEAIVSGRVNEAAGALADADDTKREQEAKNAEDPGADELHDLAFTEERPAPAMMAKAAAAPETERHEVADGQAAMRQMAQAAATPAPPAASPAPRDGAAFRRDGKEQDAIAVIAAEERRFLLAQAKAAGGTERSTVTTSADRPSGEYSLGAANAFAAPEDVVELAFEFPDKNSLDAFLMRMRVVPMEVVKGDAYAPAVERARHAGAGATSATMMSGFSAGGSGGRAANGPAEMRMLDTERFVTEPARADGRNGRWIVTIRPKAAAAE